MAGTGTNPSVVADKGGSNYNIGRGAGESTSLGGNLAPEDIEYINKLQESLKNPVPPALKPDEYFPTINRPIGVGTSYTKTLGSQTLFAAGQGLIPAGIIDAYNKAKQDSLQLYGQAFGPNALTGFENYKQLSNAFVQDDYNSAIQKATSDRVDELSKKFGGDQSKARYALRLDPVFRQTMAKYDSYARAYNDLYPQAVQILSDSVDPTKYVPDDLKKLAQQFITNHEEVGKANIDDLRKYQDKFKSTISYYALSENFIEALRKDIVTNTSESKDDIQSTMYEQAYRKTVIKTVPDINERASNAAKAYFPNDPKMQEKFVNEMKVAFPKMVDQTLQFARREDMEHKQIVRSTFGVGADNKFHETTRTNLAGGGNVNVPTFSFLGRTLSGAQPYTVFNVPANQDIYLYRKDGTEVLHGHFMANFNGVATGGINYGKDNGGVQIEGNIDASSIGQRVDILSGAKTGKVATDVLFVSTAGDKSQKFDSDMLGNYTIRIAEPLIHTELSSQFVPRGENVSMYDNMIEKFAEQEPENLKVTRDYGGKVHDISYKAAAAMFGKGNVNNEGNLVYKEAAVSEAVDNYNKKAQLSGKATYNLIPNEEYAVKYETKGLFVGSTVKGKETEGVVLEPYLPYNPLNEATYGEIAKGEKYIKEHEIKSMDRGTPGIIYGAHDIKYERSFHLIFNKTGTDMWVPLSKILNNIKGNTSEERYNKFLNGYTDINGNSIPGYHDLEWVIEPIGK